MIVALKLFSTYSSHLDFSLPIGTLKLASSLKIATKWMRNDFGLAVAIALESGSPTSNCLDGDADSIHAQLL